MQVPDPEPEAELTAARRPDAWHGHARVAYVTCGVLAAHLWAFLSMPVVMFVSLGFDAGDGPGPGPTPFILISVFWAVLCFLATVCTLSLSAMAGGVPKGVSAMVTALLITVFGVAAVALATWIRFAQGIINPMAALAAVFLFSVPASFLGGYLATRPGLKAP